MPLSQHPTDHAQKRARSTNGLCGLGVRKLSARSSLHQAPLSFFHAVSRGPPRDLLEKVKIKVDHLIQLEFGGSNDMKNLWPQPVTA